MDVSVYLKPPHTLPRQQRERSDNAEQALTQTPLVLIAHDAPQVGEEILEEVDADQMGEPSETLEAGRQQRRARFELDDAKIEREEQFKCLGLISLLVLVDDLELSFGELLSDVTLALFHPLGLLAQSGLGHRLALAAVLVLVQVDLRHALAFDACSTGSHGSELVT